MPEHKYYIYPALTRKNSRRNFLKAVLVPVAQLAISACSRFPAPNEGWYPDQFTMRIHQGMGVSDYIRAKKGQLQKNYQDIIDAGVDTGRPYHELTLFLNTDARLLSTFNDQNTARLRWMVINGRDRGQMDIITEEKNLDHLAPRGLMVDNLGLQWQIGGIEARPAISLIPEINNPDLHDKRALRLLIEPPPNRTQQYTNNIDGFSLLIHYLSGLDSADPSLANLRHYTIRNSMGA
jgi:hypothetical protein